MNVPAFPPLGLRGWCVLLLPALLALRAPAQDLNTNPGQIDSAPYAAGQAEKIELKVAQAEAQQRQQMMEQERFLMDESLKDTAERQKSLVVFPVMPPALAATQADLPALMYPVSLADYSGEIFSMAYGNLRLCGLLTPEQFKRLAEYGAARNRLGDELRARIAAANRLPADQQRQALADFSAAQQPALQKLEAEAESIRTELAALDDGTALVKYRDNPKYQDVPGMRDYCSAILAAQFHEGLSLDQRLLLHEIALESFLGTPATPPTHAFFLPAAARIRWPETPDEKLAGLRQRFQAVQQGLKAALKQAVVNPPEKLSGAKRKRAYASLAAQQAPQFDESNRLAEELRLALAGLAYPDRPLPSNLPPELVRVVGETVAGKAAFQKEATRLLKEESELSPVKLKLAFRNNQPVIETLPPANSAEQAMVGPATARLQKSNDELRRLYLELSAAAENARTETQRYRATLNADTAPSLKALTTQLAQTHAKEETWRRFSDYSTAALVPGLSPAQRRLLFQAALSSLEKSRLRSG